jgi:hypothetical protein
MFADVLTDQVGTWIFLVELQRRLTCQDQVVRDVASQTVSSTSTP